MLNGWKTESHSICLEFDGINLKHVTLFGSIYMLKVQLCHIMASNGNKYCVSEVNDGLTPMDKIAIINFKNDYTAVQTYITLLKHHCGTHGVCFSYPGLAIYVIYFVPLWLENHF